MKCVTHQIQMEEVFHIDDVWTNTGRANIYSTAQSLYNRDEDLLYSIGIITTPIHGGHVVSCERGIVGRFLGCRSRESEKIATLSKLCINTIIANCSERGIEKLPLPNALKKALTITSIQIGSQTHRELCGWFRFGEGGEFHRVTEIFIRYLQIHLRNRSCCCKNSNSQIDIIF